VRLGFLENAVTVASPPKKKQKESLTDKQLQVGRIGYTLQQTLNWSRSEKGNGVKGVEVKATEG